MRASNGGTSSSRRDKVNKSDIKFEEDVIPPFVSKFSCSAFSRADELPRLETIGTVVKLFPPTEQHDIPAVTPIQVVNGFCAYEAMHCIRKLKLDKMPVERALEAVQPDFVVKVATSHRYLQANEDDYPLVIEFSFDFGATEGDKSDGDRLEKFSPRVVAGANRLFRDVQNQAGWLSSFGLTKTVYLFEVLSSAPSKA